MEMSTSCPRAPLSPKKHLDLVGWQRYFPYNFHLLSLVRMWMKKILINFLSKSGDMIKDKEGECNFSSSKELSSIFEERSKPSPLSSSLYYGGKEDMYVKSSRPHTSGPYTDNKKDGGVDYLNGNISTDASRGNWGQGSGLCLEGPKHVIFCRLLGSGSFGAL